MTRGDRLKFTDEREMLTFHKKTGFVEESDEEIYEINENQIHLVGSRLVLDYRVTGQRMTMVIPDGMDSAEIMLERVAG